MKFLFTHVAFLIFSICSSPFIGAAEATSTRLWRQVLSSRVSRLRSRADGDWDAGSTFQRVQNTCPQPDVNNAGQQMTDMANAASTAMDDLVQGRPNNKAQMMYNSVFGIEPDAALRKGYYGIVKGTLEALVLWKSMLKCAMQECSTALLHSQTLDQTGLCIVMRVGPLTTHSARRKWAQTAQQRQVGQTWSLASLKKNAADIFQDTGRQRILQNFPVINTLKAVSPESVVLEREAGSSCTRDHWLILWTA